MFEKAELVRHQLPLMLEPGGYGFPSLYITDVEDQVLYFSTSPSHRREDSFRMHVNVLQELLAVFGDQLPVGVRRDENEDGDPVLVVLDWADKIAEAKRSAEKPLEETKRRTGFSDWLFETSLASSRALADQVSEGGE